LEGPWSLTRPLGLGEEEVKKKNKKPQGGPQGSSPGGGRGQGPQGEHKPGPETPEQSQRTTNKEPQQQTTVKEQPQTDLDPEKRKRNVLKKLREIELLKQRQANGDTLNAAQLTKIGTEDSLRAEMGEIDSKE